MGEDHRQGGGAALDRLELQDGGRARDLRLRQRGALGRRGGRGLLGGGFRYRANSSHIVKAATDASSATSAASSAGG
jgi:hypothetical protein